MDEKTYLYRQKHKKCKYCKYYHTEGKLGICFYWKCFIKDEEIIFKSFPRHFCKYYEVNIDEDR